MALRLLEHCGRDQSQLGALLRNNEVDMAKLKKIPDDWIRPNGAKDIRPGETGWFEAKSLLVDTDHHGWIDPNAKTVDESFPGPKLGFERLENGFEIVLSHDFLKSHMWETLPKPPGGDGQLAWLRVTRIVVSDDA